MKKMAAFLLSVALLFACAGCSETAPEEVSQSDWVTVPTPNPDVSTEEPVKVGETFSMAGEYTGGDTGSSEPGKLEVTVLGYQVYDHYSDTGIPKEEFSCGEKFEIPETPLVMVEMKIKKVSGAKEDTGMDSRENFTRFQLYSKEQLQWCKDHDETPGEKLADYFSDHGELGKDYKGYSYYWLDVGEEKTYQIGFFLNDPNGPLGDDDDFTSVDSGLMLGVDTNGTGYTSLYVDLET